MSKRRRVRSREDFFENWDQSQQLEFSRGDLGIEPRFPGPAGLIPKLQDPISLNTPESQVSTGVDIIIATDQTTNVQIATPVEDVLNFSNEPWRALLKELDLEPGVGLLNEASIEWVLKKYPHLTDAEKNIPFLAGVVEEDPTRGRLQEPLMTVKCTDSTGSIYVSVDPKIVRGYEGMITKGTAIAMCNVNVLEIVNGYNLVLLPLKKLIMICTLVEDEVVVTRLKDDFDVNEALSSYVKLNEIWPAAQVFNFWMVPIQHRVLFAQSVAVLWNTYLSYKTNRSQESVEPTPVEKNLL